MYSMWHPHLLMLLNMFQNTINPLDIMEYEELVECVKQALHETINEYAWKLMMTHNLSLAEARYIVVKNIR